MSAAAPEEPRPVRFGIMTWGCSSLASTMLRALSPAPAAALATVGSRYQGEMRLFAYENGPWDGTRLHESYEALLDDPNVDAVYLPLPTSHHMKWAVAAAGRGKHVLLETPTALCAADLDAILAACEKNGIQFMDSTMWMHHPRTANMRELLDGRSTIGDVRFINSVFSFRNDDDLHLYSDIREKPNLDALGALGDLGWYCIRAILWAVDYKLPRNVIALRDPVKNKASVLLACSATLYWTDGKIATFHCSFLTNRTMDVTVLGTFGTLHVTDFFIPYEKKSGHFSVATGSNYAELHTAGVPEPRRHVVKTEVPQEALMVQEFCRLVQRIRDGGASAERKWPAISRKTQVVMDAVKTSIDNGFESVDVTS